MFENLKELLVIKFNCSIVLFDSTKLLLFEKMIGGVRDSSKTGLWSKQYCSSEIKDVTATV
jgi:hypothetical protein